jgi:hypothetical protein
VRIVERRGAHVEFGGWMGQSRATHDYHPFRDRSVAKPAGQLAACSQCPIRCYRLPQVRSRPPKLWARRSYMSTPRGTQGFGNGRPKLDQRRLTKRHLPARGRVILRLAGEPLNESGGYGPVEPLTASVSATRGGFLIWLPPKLCSVHQTLDQTMCAAEAAQMEAATPRRPHRRVVREATTPGLGNAKARQP